MVNRIFGDDRGGNCDRVVIVDQDGNRVSTRNVRAGHGERIAARCNVLYGDRGWRAHVEVRDRLGLGPLWLWIAITCVNATWFIVRMVWK